MKKYNFYILFPLFISLFIYLFYRTERTVVNDLFISIFSFNTYSSLKDQITSILPLQEYIIYSLPEGLWIFSITLTSKDLYIPIANKKLSGAYIPIAFAVCLEWFQLIGLRPGTFDFLDITSAFLFWITAYILVPSPYQKMNILNRFNIRTKSFIFSYSIVFLAHVWQ